MNQEYFNYCVGETMTSPAFDRLFGGPRRSPTSEITQRERNLAASIQSVTETILMKMAAYLHLETGMKNLCIAGGVALNCVANGRLLREGPFEQVWVQPAAGDSGGAIGRRFSSGTNCWVSVVNLPVSRRPFSDRRRIASPSKPVSMN